MFNYRGESSNVFVYYKDVRYSSSYTDTAPANIDPNYQRRWMENKCTLGLQTNRGVEWDWLAFYYRVWNSGTYKLDVDEIRDIWPRDPDPDSDYEWNNILSSANGTLSANEYQNFENEGAGCGVNH